MRLIFRVVLCSFLLMMSSCVEDVNFSQAEDLEITPVVLASLVNSTITQNELVFGGVEINRPIEQTSLFTIFNNEQTRDNLERIVLQFAINNQFNRGFRIEFFFLDGAGNETLSPITLNVNPNQSDFNQEEEIILANEPAFTNTRNVRTRIELLPSSDGSIIDVNVPTSLTFRSAGTLYFRVN
ncbi:hypothetical protein [Tenacibaculum jejuense]|uniref:Probable lipoprotein n=1 Tax=Tenacibaculum jejuense TaxID=584609 RepID=A0A238UD13_9FLAO|nr:hypothetical protein [Tenacibaculum jejuense]SNR17097.1 Probable lipoprotein precursor [Tenacibaculum jejuense]